MVKTYAKLVHMCSNYYRTRKHKKETSIISYNGGSKTNAAIRKRKANYPEKCPKCYNCKYLGPFSKCCKSTKNIQKVDKEIEINNYMKQTQVKNYSVNLFFRMTTQNVLKNQNNGDFKDEVVVTDTIIADTGANISIYSLHQAPKNGSLPIKFFLQNKSKSFNSDGFKK